MEPSRRKRIGVLVGGPAAEGAVSRRAGEAVRATLEEAGFGATLVHVDRDLDLALRQERVDVAFLAARGRGAAGPVQGLLETLGVPYTGSSCAAAALAADKLRTKELLRLHNLPTPAYYRHSRGMGTAAQQHHAFGFPCVVKPRVGASGAGVAVARDLDELEAAVETALGFDDDVLVERLVAGCEVQVAILDGEVLGAAEVSPAGADLTTRRRSSSRARVHVPPRLGVERLRGVLTQALRAHHLLGCSGLTRVDVMVAERGNESLLEVDTQPDLSAGALVPKLAHAAGLGFAGLALRVLAGARLHGGRRAGLGLAHEQPAVVGERRAHGAERH